MFATTGSRAGRKRSTSSVLPTLLGANTVTTPGDGFKYYKFTTSGTLVVPGKLAVPVLYLVVGGGGAGWCYDGTYYGGGGAAGCKRNGSMLLQPGSYPIVIGPGGATTTTAAASNAGTSSSFNGVTATPGGGSYGATLGGSNADFTTRRGTVDGVNAGGGNGSMGIGGSATSDFDNDTYGPNLYWRGCGGLGFRWIDGIVYAKGGVAGSMGEGVGAASANTGNGGAGGTTHGWAGSSGIVIVAVKT